MDETTKLKKELMETKNRLKKIENVIFGLKSDEVFDKKITKIVEKNAKKIPKLSDSTADVKSNTLVVSTSYTRVRPETGTTDDIDNIYLAGANQRSLIILRTTGSGNVVTVKDGVGNLNLAGDFAMGTEDTITLQGNGTVWYEVSRSNN